MGPVTDLPLRESTGPRGYAMAENVTIALPSGWNCVRLGFWFAVGIWCAFVVLAIPTAVIIGRIYPIIWLNMMRGMFGV